MSDITIYCQLSLCLPSGGWDNFLFADNPGAIARRPTFAAWIRLRQGARNHQGDVILLFATAAELLHRLNNCLEKWSHGKVKIATKGRQQTGLAKLFPIGVC